MQNWRWWVLGAVAVGILGFWFWPSPYCRSAKREYGIEVPQCPDGQVRQVLRISGNQLRRGGEGRAFVYATALYTVAQADSAQRTAIPEVDATFFLVDAKGKEQPLPPPPHSAIKPRYKPTRGVGFVGMPVWLPASLDDGDYLLRAKVKTKVGQGQVDLPLALYAPARIHVLTDRPLYEPGNRILFRALVVRARDLSPLDHRPGTWIVKDPGGNVMLEEKAPAGRWGVASGDFLLDGQAPTGDWSVTWRSGGREESAKVRVEPFTLPRFRVSVTTDRPFYQAGATPRVSGSVVYSSGAPVRGAKVALRWRVEGSWPPPPSWLTGAKGALPQSATTDEAGRFKLELPAVPADLQGRATLLAQLSAVDPVGDKVDGALSVLLSQDALQVSAITPLANGLVQGFNNRLYLRVTTADGQPLAGAQLSVRKAWIDDDEGVAAQLDEESVARIQVDPGAPVNVVIPPRPVRKTVRDDAVVRRTRAYDLVAREDASLDDQVKMDGWIKALTPCAKWRSEDEIEAQLALRVAPGGAIVSGAAEGNLGKCALARIGRGPLAKGKDRLYGVTFEFSEPKLPKVEVALLQAYGDAPEGLEQLVAAAARDARDCLPKKGQGQLPWVLGWRLESKARKLRAEWIRSADGVSARKVAGADRCLLSRLAKRELPKPAATLAMGVIRYTLEQPESADEEGRPQPTIVKGYELLVAAARDGKTLGQTKLRLSPGRIPALTLRADPVLARPGDKVTLKFLRGPSYHGVVPRMIRVEHEGTSTYLELKKDEKKVDYVLPKDKKGWFVFVATGAKALVFSRAASELSVKVQSEKPRYAPGSSARLLVTTRSGQRGIAAAVGLFGVDSSLEQLVPLPGADALRALRPTVEMKRKAFGMLDGQALALGRIRGRHAAEATILQVASVPQPEELDVVLSGSASTPFDANVALTDRFYGVLAVLHQRVRRWEREAPKGELMKPAVMATLWNEALKLAEQRGLEVRDAFGRPMRLHRLPNDLLELTNPRQVVAVGTRLPEDVENWPRWVARRRP